MVGDGAGSLGLRGEGVGVGVGVGVSLGTGGGIIVGSGIGLMVGSGTGGGGIGVGSGIGLIVGAGSGGVGVTRAFAVRTTLKTPLFVMVAAKMPDIRISENKITTAVLFNINPPFVSLIISLTACHKNSGWGL